MCEGEGRHSSPVRVEFSGIWQPLAAFFSFSPLEICFPEMLLPHNDNRAEKGATAGKGNEIGKKEVKLSPSPGCK